MRVAFTGASSTGKTACATDLVERLNLERPNGRGLFTLATVGGRALLDALGEKSVAATAPPVLVGYQIMYIGAKMESERLPARLVTDRSFGDCLAYWRIHCAGNVSNELSNKIERLCFERIRRYDHHFIFPTGVIRFEDDGYRSPDGPYHEIFESALLEVYREAGIDCVPVPPGCVEERVKWVFDRIDGRR